MANPTQAFGLRAVRMMDGTAYYPHVKYCHATGASGDLFVGDPVKWAGTSNTAQFQGYPIGTLPQVQVADDGDGDPIWGVCVGVLPVTDDSLVYRADSTDRVILVDSRPNVVWAVRSNAASTAIALTDVGAYANLKVGTGDTVLGLSGWTLDTTDGPDTADASNQLLILGLSQGYPTNDVGANAVYDVLINNHAFAQAADAGRATGT